MRASDGQSFQRAGFDVRMRRRQCGKGHLRGAADDRLDRRAGTRKRHMGDLNAADDLEQLARQMRRGADAGAGIIEFVGIGLGARDQVGDRIDAQF